jgi:hypothetical protein
MLTSSFIRELSDQVDHLPDVVMEMDCTSQVDAESVIDIICPSGRVFCSPRQIGLGLKRVGDNNQRLIQLLQDFVFMLRMVFRKFQLTLADRVRPAYKPRRRPYPYWRQGRRLLMSQVSAKGFGERRSAIS